MSIPEHVPQPAAEPLPPSPSDRTRGDGQAPGETRVLSRAGDTVVPVTTPSPPSQLPVVDTPAATSDDAAGAPTRVRLPPGMGAASAVTSVGGPGVAYWAGAPTPVLVLVLVVPLLVVMAPPLLNLVLPLCRWWSAHQSLRVIVEAARKDPDKHLAAAERALDKLTPRS